MERAGKFNDFQIAKRRLNQHLRSKLHAARNETHLFERSFRESAHAAVAVLNAQPEEQADQCSEYRCPEIAVERRHGTGLDVATESTTHR